MEEGPSKGRGRGRGLLLFAQRRAAEAKATAESAAKAEEESQATATVPEAKPEAPKTEPVAPPVALGRGRASFLRAKAAESSSAQAISAPPQVQGPPISQGGRGRGFLAKLGATSVPATEKIGQVSMDDAETFRSEEFETSSRIGGDAGRRIDMEALTKKLEVKLINI